MTDNASANIIEHLTEAMVLSAYGHDAGHNYVTITHEPGAFVLSPYIGKNMNLPKGQGDEILGSAVRNLGIALEAAGIHVTTSTETKGLTERGTAPVRLSYDEKTAELGHKLDKAVELSEKLRKVNHAVSNWYGNWHVKSGHKLGVQVKPLEFKDGRLNLIIDAHDGSVTGPLRTAGAKTNGYIPASFMPELGKLCEKLGALGMDLRSIEVRNSPSPHYRGDSVEISIPAPLLDKVSLRPTRGTADHMAQPVR